MNQTITLKAARTELKRVGCGRAQGPALAAMFADMIVDTTALPRGEDSRDRLYQHLTRQGDQIAKVAQQLLEDPMSALEIVFAEPST